MRALALALLVLAPALAPVLAEPAPIGGPRLAIEAQAPEPLPAGAEETIVVPVQRRIGDEPVPGPGQVDLRLDASQTPACGPEHQSVELDPRTGRGRGEVVCQPGQPGRWELGLQAQAPGHEEGTWSPELVVHPDELRGSLEVGEASAYRFPASLTLEPSHLDAAPVNVTIEADLAASPLGFTLGPFEATADGAAIDRELVARHGPGSYHLLARATGPVTQDWQARANVSVAQPPDQAAWELNATVAPGEPNVALRSDSVNADGKTKRPGDELITRLAVEHAEEVNVTVLRAEGDQRVELDRRTLDVGPTGRLEHVFAHDPLPAGQLWVQAEAGDSSVARTAQIRDVRAGAELAGPKAVLADGRSWEGQLTLADANLGSTPADPGPVFGLPDVSWTVYRGSLVAEGFAVRLGPFAGPSEAEATTSQIAWPHGSQDVHVEAGRARLPVTITPPSDAEPGTYRLSVYAPDGTRLGGGSWTLEAPPQLALDASPPRPGEALELAVDVEHPLAGTSVELVVHAEEEPVGNASLAPPGNASIQLPAPLPAGTPIRVEAWADWPGRPPAGGPDAVHEAAVADVGPNVTVHAALDGRPTRTPVPVHPAGAHDVELAYTARDPNTGPVDLASVHVEGPEGAPGWNVEHADGLVHVHVPEQVAVGRYVVELATEDVDEREPGLARVPLEVAPTLRLHAEGPEELELRQGQTREAELSVENLGSLPVERVRVFAQTELDVSLAASNGTRWVDEHEPLGLALAPGETAAIPVRFTADGRTGRGSVTVTVAGVLG